MVTETLPTPPMPPAPPAAPGRTEQDLQQLKLLSVFHYVVAGLTTAFSLFPLMYVAMGTVFLTLPESSWEGGEAPPPFVGWLISGIGGCFLAAVLALAILTALAGRNLARRRRYTFCLVVAAINCLIVPIGTALGVFTIILLMRPSVKALFEGQPAVTSETAATV